MSKSSNRRSRQSWQPLNWQSQLIATLGVLAINNVHQIQFNQFKLLQSEQLHTKTNQQEAIIQQVHPESR